MKPISSAFIFAGLALTFLVLPMAASAQGAHGNPGVSSPEANYLGLSYGEWAARWWQWVFSIPGDSDHPFNPGGDVLQNQAGNVWFLVGVFGFEEREITIPAGKALFFPVLNVECSTLEAEPFHGDDAPSLSACANGYLDQTSGLACEIDGKSVKSLASFRTESPMFTFGPLPDPNLYGLPVGATGQAVDAGFYVMLPPLGVGEHTIHFSGTFDVFEASIDTTYNVTVEP